MERTRVATSGTVSGLMACTAEADGLCDHEVIYPPEAEIWPLPAMCASQVLLEDHSVARSPGRFPPSIAQRVANADARDLAIYGNQIPDFSI